MEPAAPSTPRDGETLFWRPVLLVAFALLSALLGPLAIQWAQGGMQYMLQSTVLPARELTAARRSAIERGIAAHSAYLSSGNPELLRRADAARARNEKISAELRPLVARLRPESRAAYAHLAAIEEGTAELHIPDNPTREELSRVLPLLEERQDSVDAALARVDLALDREEAEHRARLSTFAHWTSGLTAVLSLLSLAAIVSVTRLTRRERQARVAAENAVRARDEVVSIVSHDLRNPLNTVGMAASLLSDSVAPDESRGAERKYLGIIERACATMDRIIQDLLDIARIESGRLAVEPHSVPAAELVDEAATMLRPVAEKNGQRLDCAALDGLPAVRADRDRVMQIFSNLAGNAIKFTPAGGTITLAAEPDGTGVRFRVTDTGSGIPAENIPHLFDRFWQASRTDRRGIGLGLPIVKGLVEAHGGSIHVESRVGEGTTFFFTLPAT